MNHATSMGTIVKHAVQWSIVLSILMIVAGALAIMSPLAAGEVVTVIVGVMFIVSGVAHIVFGWEVRELRTAGGLAWELLLGALYIAMGVYLLAHVSVGLTSLTLALAIYLFLEAVLEFGLSFQLRPLPGSGWLLFDGIVSLILAILIWRTWPANTIWVIGTLVGISMLFSGVSRLAFSLAAHDVVKQLP
jgi:uncharacterized membrane protein HdeD (DUF308 family)